MVSEVTELRTESRSISRFAGKKVHFIGIGGCGMSGLAKILIDAGAVVSGSEPKPNETTLQLRKRGASISRDQLGELLTKDIDLVVRTAAIPETNPEYLAARRLGLKQIKYAQLLGQIMKERLGIAVSGTHGKSTTTAMISHALLACGVDPSFVIGGTVPQLGGGSHSGKGEAFVVEACEYDRSFHNLHPRIALITNIEADHLDCYKNIFEIIASFHHFAGLVPSDGLIIANGKDPRVRQALVALRTPVQWVALNDNADWVARTTSIEDGCYCAEILRLGQQVATMKLSVAGEHNLFNATAALAACVHVGVHPQAAADALGTFAGVDRRMTHKGQFNGANVIDDYGHHPTEIRTTLKALREKYRPQRLICVFQPHQHSRTRLLLEEFATAFGQADRVIIPDIYAVRDSEEDRRSIHATDLVDRVNRNTKNATYLPDPAAILAQLRSEARPGDLILTIGAGNVCEIASELVQ